MLVTCLVGYVGSVKGVAKILRYRRSEATRIRSNIFATGRSPLPLIRYALISYCPRGKSKAFSSCLAASVKWGIQGGNAPLVGFGAKPQWGQGEPLARGFCLAKTILAKDRNRHFMGVPICVFSSSIKLRKFDTAMLDICLAYFVCKNRQVSSIIL